MTNTDLVCGSCDNPKLNLQWVNSKISEDIKFLACSDCISKGFEPRYLIIIAIRSGGRNERIDKYVKQHLYVGDEIPLSVDIA